MRSLLALCLLTSPALACDTPLFNCTLSNNTRVVELCQTATGFSYAYGKRGQAPELTLTEPLEAGTYTPWPGVGRAIWESIAFRNQDHAYEVWSSIDRMSDDAPLEGGINILRGDALQTTLSCDAGSVTSRIEDAYESMQGAGFCQDDTTRAWVRPCP